MNKLKQLQAIQSKLMKDNKWSYGQANAHMASRLSCALNTVEGWLTKSQTRPIPDYALALLKLFTQS